MTANGLPLGRELDTALQAVRRCCHVCRRIQKSIAPETLDKKDKSPVTIADYASQAIVGKLLSEVFSEDVLVAEEGAEMLCNEQHAAFLARIRAELAADGLAGSEADVVGWVGRGSGTPTARFWTLDPIDGTKGFLRGGQYAVSLALIIDGAVQLGVVGLPNFPRQGAPDPQRPPVDSSCGLILHAVRGGGVYVDHVDGPSERARIARVTTTERSAEARWTESVESGHSAHDVSARIAQRLGMVREPLRIDSQAKYAAVALGLADAYLRMPTRKDYREKIWDHAGGAILVEEAGGRVTDIDGRPLDFTRGRELTQNRGVLVTNRRLHQQMLTAISQG